MWATRNRIAHGYAFVDLSIIQLTVDNDLPEIKAIINRMIRDQSDGGSGNAAQP